MHAAYPQGVLSTLYQLKSALPVDFDLVSHGNERLCAEKHLSVLRRGDVVVYDRGYFSYVLLHLHCETQIHAVFRLQANCGPVISDFIAGTKTDVVVELYPSSETLKDIASNRPELLMVPHTVLSRVADTVASQTGFSAAEVRFGNA